MLPRPDTRRAPTTLYRRRLAGTEDGPEGGEVPVYEEAVPFAGRVQPAGGALDTEVYGDRVTDMLKVFIDGRSPVEKGDGVCVYVQPTSPPDYRVTDAQNWPSGAVAHLERWVESA